MHSYNLRPRRPKRTDPLLCAIFDGVQCEDILRTIAMLAIWSPPRYKLRRRKSVNVFF